MGSRGLLVAAVLVACNGDGSGSDATTADTSGTTSPPTSDGLVPGSSSETTSPADLPAPDPLEPYPSCADGMCPIGSECIQLAGASICGPNCLEYGPGYAGRCEHSPPLNTLCPWTEEVPGICILSCSTTEDCPAPGMICLPCESPFEHACQMFAPAFDFEGASMCAWPNP